MPRARTRKYYPEQKAAPDENNGGCLFFFGVPLVAGLLTTCWLIAITQNLSTHAAALPISQPVTRGTISPIFTREVQFWDVEILRWANASSLDPNLVATIMQIESCGDPNALSRSGAMGLFQVMPFHFRPGENGFETEVNAKRGLEYLWGSLQYANGNPRLAMAGYNGGIGVISRGEWTWPGETQRYVYYGEPIYNDARSGLSSSMMLNEWYQNYGAGMCGRAADQLGVSH